MSMSDTSAVRKRFCAYGGGLACGPSFEVRLDFRDRGLASVDCSKPGGVAWASFREPNRRRPCCSMSVTVPTRCGFRSDGGSPSRAPTSIRRLVLRGRGVALAGFSKSACSGSTFKESKRRWLCCSMSATVPTRCGLRNAGGGFSRSVRDLEPASPRPGPAAVSRTPGRRFRPDRATLSPPPPCKGSCSPESGCRPSPPR